MYQHKVTSKLKSALPKYHIDDYQKGQTAGVNISLLSLSEHDDPEKIVVPKLVDDRCEIYNYYFEWNLYNLCVDFDQLELPDDLHGWFTKNNNKAIETLVMMHKLGYEVQKEKLYTVEIPNPNDSGYSKIYLAKNKDGKVELFTWSGYTSIEFADNWKQEENAQLTESEIKKDFEWAWQLAKEVEE